MMKQPGILRIILLTVLSILTSFSTLPALDSCYHNSEEILQTLLDFQNEYPDWVKVDSIGHSSQYGKPIWMAKLSDNPDQVEAEPALLYVGQVHAEELAGVELTLEIMRSLLTGLDEAANRERLEQLELYFIPTANPEGIDVVFSGDDITFRKNCRDNVGDGEFRYRPGWGWDSSGVDINRNFGLHWDRGDSLFFRGDVAGVYNYYRGSAPFSETESQALRDLALDRRFLFSFIYHSSRSGNNSESIIAPWYWDGKNPPDNEVIDRLLDEIVERTPSFDGEGFYEGVHATQRNGQTTDWFYQATGSLQYMIELSDHIHPDSVDLYHVINDNMSAAFFLMDLAYGAETMASIGSLTIMATDANTGAPLRAEVIIDQISCPLLEPRLSSQEGRLDWMLPALSYTGSVKCAGYQPFILENLDITARENLSVEVALTPLNRVQAIFRARDRETRETVQAEMNLIPDYGPTMQIDLPGLGDHYTISVGSYHVQIIAEGYLPYIAEINIQESQNWNFDLVESEVSFRQEFSELDEWQRGGAGQDWNIVERDGRLALTESPDGDYSSGSTAWLLFEPEVYHNPLAGTVIRLVHQPYFEPGVDDGLLRVWDAVQSGWVSVGIFSQFPDGWDTTYVSLSQIPSGELLIRLEVHSDNAVEEDGWLIDDLTVFSGEKIYSAGEQVSQPCMFNLSTFPNPANSATMVRVSLDRSQFGQLNLYNIAGQRLGIVRSGQFSAGINAVPVRFQALPSGLYFIQFRSASNNAVIPLNLLK